MENEQVTLEVEVNKPNVTLKWFKDGQDVSPEDRIDVTIEGCVHKVHIKSAILTDEGLYKVTVGLLISEAPLTVQGITYRGYPVEGGGFADSSILTMLL